MFGLMDYSHRSCAEKKKNKEELEKEMLVYFRK